MDIVLVLKRYVLPGVCVAFLAIVAGMFAYQTGITQEIFVQSARVGYDVPTDNLRKVTLKNGMDAILFKDTSTPRVLVQIAYNVGSAVETSSERGLAHLIEHMIFKGTQKLTEGDIDAIARKFGASHNAFTSNDVTSYYFESDKGNWKNFLGILADCMKNTRFDSQHLASEVKAVIQELNMYKDSHVRLMFEKAMELLFPPNHPYHFPIIGYLEDLAGLKSENLKRFYDKFYQPQNATLFLVGDFDLDDAAANVESIFGGLESHPETESRIPFPKLSPSSTSASLTLYEDVGKEWLGLFWLIPGEKEQQGSQVVQVLADILAGDEGSRLYRRLVDEEKIADTVMCEAEEMLESGMLALFIAPKEGKSEACQKAVLEELAKVVAGGITQVDIDRSVAGAMTSFFKGLEKPSDLVYEWIGSYFATGDEKALFKKPDHYYAVTPQAIQEFAKNYLDGFFVKKIELLPLPEDKRVFWQQDKVASKQLEKEILQLHQRTAPIEEASFVNTMPDPQPFDLTFPQPTQSLTLSNGLRVLLCEKKDLPLTTAHLRFRDAESLTRSIEGLRLDCMMEMLMEHSQGSSKEDNVNFFKSLGAGYSFDNSGCSLVSLDANFNQVLQRFFHIVCKPDFKADAFDKVKELFISGYVRGKDSVRSMASRLLSCKMYAGSGFAWTYDDAIEVTKNMTLAQMKQLHKAYLAPENMVLTIVGSFDADEVKSMLEGQTSDWGGGSYSPYDPGKSNFVPNQQVDHAMLRDQGVLLLAKPSSVTLTDPDRIPLKVLNYITFHSLGSRLYELRERTGLFYNATGGFAVKSMKEPGFNYVMALLSPETFEASEGKLKEVLELLARDGITQTELAEARQLYGRSMLGLSATRSSVASVLGFLEVYELGFDYHEKAWDRVQKMSVAQLNEIAAKHSSTEGMIRIRVGRV